MFYCKIIIFIIKEKYFRVCYFIEKTKICFNFYESKTLTMQCIITNYASLQFTIADHNSIIAK